MAYARDGDNVDGQSVETRFRQVLLQAAGERIQVVQAQPWPRRIRIYLPPIGGVEPIVAVGGSGIGFLGAGAKTLDAVQLRVGEWQELILGPNQNLYTMGGGAMPACALNIIIERIWGVE